MIFIHNIPFNSSLTSIIDRSDLSLDGEPGGSAASAARDRTGLRWVDDSVAFFRLAVLEAEGIHEIKSPHPLFFRFYQDGRDPEQIVATYAQEGLRNTFVLLGAVFLANVSIMVYGAKRLITTKTPTLDDF